MILSSEYKAIINECRDNLNRWDCENWACQNCTTIHSAYFLRYFRPADSETIQRLLGQKSWKGTELIEIRDEGNRD